MDNVTHTLVGVAMARAGLSKRFGKGTTLVLAVASNLPDLDVFLPMLSGQPAWIVRRMVTHSVVGIPVIAAIAAFVFHWFYRHIAYRTMLGLTLLGMAVHVLFDLINSYGVVALWPFSHQRFELAWVFIIDLLILGILATPILLDRMLKGQTDSKLLYRRALKILGGYLVLCGLSRAYASHLMNVWALNGHRQPSFSYVFPEALGPHRFRGVIKEGNTYTVILNNTLRGSTEIIETIPTDENDPEASLS